MALGAALLVTMHQTPARAADPVPFDEQTVHGALFGAVVQTRDAGVAGLKDALLTAELLDWRATHQGADAGQVAGHAAATRAVADAAVPDSAGDDRSRFAVAMAVLARLGQATSTGAVTNGPTVRAFLTSTVGAEGANVVPETLNLVRGGYQDAAWNARSRELVWSTWTQLHRRAAADDALATGWDTAFAGRTGTGVRTPVDTLLATKIHEPRAGGNTGTLGYYVPLAAIRDERDDATAYRALVQERALAALAVLDTGGRTRVEEVISRSTAHPVNEDPKPSQAVIDEEKRKTAENKIIFEGLGSTVSVLSTLVGFVDPGFGKQLETIGKAVVTSVTAINTYMMTVLGQGLGTAAVAMGTAVMTGNLLGAAVSLIGLFTGGGDPNAAIRAEIGKLRDQINRLAQGIDKRFDRIESALREMYSGLVAQLGELLKTLDEVRANLGRIATQLQTIERKVDSMALATHVALENIARSELNSVITTYVHHREITGQPIPDYVNTYYPKAESPTFKFATVDAAQEGTFTAPAGTSLADPVGVLDLYLPEGSINYLSQWARNKVGGTWTTGPVANAAAWNTAARVYNILQLENPAYAVQVSPGRAAAVAVAGDTINERVREFNRPKADGTTNDLFTRLMADYRNAVVAWNQQVENVRKGVIWNGNDQPAPVHDMWGSPDQELPAANRIPETESMGGCTTTVNRPARSVPATIRRANLPNPFHLTHHAMPPGHKPTFATCYEAQFVNVEENEGPRFHTWSGDLQITLRSRVKWATGDWQTVQTATRVFPIGTYCSWSTTSPTPSGYCYDENKYLNERWGTYRAAFESAAIPVSTAQTATARTKAAAMLAGRQKYFYRVMRAGTGPNPPSPDTWEVAQTLWQRGKAVSNALRMLQAYTELGWASALEQDDSLNALLFGANGLPADYTRPRNDADQSLNQHLYNAFTQAVVNYAGCEQTVDWDACAGDKSGFDPQLNQGQYGVGCVQADIADKPREPVSGCLAGTAAARLALLQQRYDHWSGRLRSGTHTEGLPKVSAAVDMTRATNTNLH
ncbi:hypothetical protein MCAG_01017 [Micromonospora sp. ATCC 39149]|uniref:Uncharacterized protein n=1 Tax=Micromonospora carbonacea TaxID=47853 RepID=A0A7D6C9M0_9ACTN|nr:hypothetical protein [Micromonospora sp. ATCC 39149]EEP70690.1 hypothetical protein MCAG_01017 [Micromonospora sp. ATCC 39149]QLJ97042.1 hypothetical protein HZU44_19530 [Micromonospora carbonacea]